MQYQIELKLPVSLPPTRSTPVVIVDEAEYLAMQQRIRELEQQVEDDHVAATIQLQALTIERDDARQRIQELEGEIAEQQSSFELRWNADMRAIQQWQEATGKELQWPNHIDLCVWLMRQLDNAQAELARLREQGQWEPLTVGTLSIDNATMVVGNDTLSVICDAGDGDDVGVMTWDLPMSIRLCRNPNAQPQPASVPDNEVLDWLKRLVIAKENEMLCYIQRYNYEESSTQLATCRAALAWLDAQPPQATAPDNDARD